MICMDYSRVLLFYGCCGGGLVYVLTVGVSDVHFFYCMYIMYDYQFQVELWAVVIV